MPEKQRKNKGRILTGIATGTQLSVEPKKTKRTKIIVRAMEA